MADFPKLPRIKQDDENMEKLHSAAAQGQISIVRKIISSGVPANISNKFGCTALHWAIRQGQIPMMKELTPLSDISQMWHGQKPLNIAIYKGNIEVIEEFINCVKQSGKDINLMLNENDEYKCTEIGNYPIHVSGQTCLHIAVSMEYYHIVDLLLDMGSSPYTKDLTGQTSLMRTIQYNQIDMFNKLLIPRNDQQYRFDVTDKHCRSHLHYALEYNQIEIAQKLIELDHEINLEDDNKITPFILSVYNAIPSILELVLKKLDVFALQSAPFHNGSIVQPERILWTQFANENEKENVIKLIQDKLDELNKANGTSKKKKPKKKK